MLTRIALITLAAVVVASTVGCDGDGAASATPLVPRTVTEDRALQALDLSGTRVHVRTMGNPKGRVLIVLHGGPGDDFVYMLPLAGRAAGKSLTDDHLLVFWDQRSSGLSRRHDP